MTHPLKHWHKPHLSDLWPPVPSFWRSVQHAVPQSRTRWRHWAAALYSTCSSPARFLIVPPSFADGAPVVSSEGSPLCGACVTTKLCSLLGWFYMESWGREGRCQRKSTTLNCLWSLITWKVFNIIFIIIWVKVFTILNTYHNWEVVRGRDILYQNCWFIKCKIHYK